MARRKRIGTTTVERVTFRYSNYDTPFWARANTRPGRWHHAGDGATQYLSYSTDGSWADLLRNEDLHTPEEVNLVRMTLWQARVDQSYLVDYSDFDRAEKAGFPPEALIDDDQERCRDEGRRLRELGYAGIIAPSAALPGETSLTLFGPRISIALDAHPLLSSAIPAGVLTKGAPPSELISRVRYLGQPHDEYGAYRSTRAAARRRGQR